MAVAFWKNLFLFVSHVTKLDRLRDCPRALWGIFFIRSGGIGSVAMLIMKRVQRFLKSVDGATAVEYGLLAALIATVIITAVTTIGTEVNETFSTIGNTLKSQGN